MPKRRSEFEEEEDTEGGLQNSDNAYLAASFCSSARLFCSSWARWSSLSRARRASTSAARFASASRLGSISYPCSLLFYCYD